MRVNSSVFDSMRDPSESWCEDVGSNLNEGGIIFSDFLTTLYGIDFGNELR